MEKSRTKLLHVKSLPPVIVVWEDATCDDYDGTIAELPETGTVINKTIGFLIKKTKKEIVTVRDITELENTIRSAYSIPRRLVKAIIYLKEQENG